MFNKAFLQEKLCFSDTKILEHSLLKVLMEKSLWNSLLLFLSVEREVLSSIREVLIISGKMEPGNWRVDRSLPLAVQTSGDQPWDFFGRNDAKAETPVLWPPHEKS